MDWSDRIRIIYAGDDTTDEDAMAALKVRRCCLDCDLSNTALLQGLAFSFRVVSSHLIQTQAEMR